MNILRPSLWFLVATIIVTYLLAITLSAQRSFRVETDILALLPAAEHDTVAAQASRAIDKQLAKQHLILVGDSDRGTALHAAEMLAASLQNTPFIASVHFRLDANAMTAANDFLYPYAAGLLDNSTRRLLQNKGGAIYTQQLVRYLYSPLTVLPADALERDPLLLFHRYRQAQPLPANNLSLIDNVAVAKHNDEYFAMINLALDTSPFSLALHASLLPTLDRSMDAVRQAFPSVTLIDTGAARYANAGVSSARSEITTIGLGSLCAVVALLLVVFRSILPLFASALPIAVGFVAALAACQWLFGSVHILTLVFGASLIGISIDYSFHFFADRLGDDTNWSGERALRRIFPGISLGLATSALGYAGLLSTPFPAMQQMAVFSIVGLAAAFLTVACLFPSLARHSDKPGGAARIIEISQRARALFSWPTLYSTAAITIIAAGAFVGIVQLEAVDDIRTLQSAPAQLRADEQRVQNILGTAIGSQYLLVEGADDEMLLQRSEQLGLQLAEWVATGRLQHFRNISDYLPSLQRQRENRALVTSALIDKSSTLQRYADQLGLQSTAIDSFIARYQNRDAALLPMQDWLDSPASPAARALWLGKTERGVAALVPLYGTDPALTDTIDRLEGVRLLDNAGRISDMLERYRLRASVIVTLSYAAIILLLSVRYGPRKTLRIVMPPALAAMVALGTLGWLGMPLNIFHLLALLLVLGVGIDYTLFLEEGVEHFDTTLIAIGLSAFTTMVSFGLLALSATPAVSAFGITVLIGIGGSLLFALILADKKITSTHS